MTYAFFKLLHILSMAAWLGAALWVPGDVKRSLARGGAHLGPLAERAGPAIRLDLYAGVATVATGLVLLWRRGWLAHVPMWIGSAFGITLLALVSAVLLPTWNRLAARLGAGDAQGAAAVAPRLAAAAGAGHLLWLVALSLMVLPL